MAHGNKPTVTESEAVTKCRVSERAGILCHPPPYGQQNQVRSVQGTPIVNPVPKAVRAGA